MIDPQLIRLRLLTNLGAPPRVCSTESVIAALTFGRQSARCGLEVLAEMLGHSGDYEAKRKFAQRALDDSRDWQQENGIRLSEVLRGGGKEKITTAFGQNFLNQATLSISAQLQNENSPLPLIALIDERAPAAILSFLKSPLSLVKPKSTPKPKRGRRGAGAFISRDANVPLPVYLTAILEWAGKFQFRLLPVDQKKPRTAHFVQGATRNRVVLAKWSKRWENTDFAVLTGARLPNGGFLVVLDKDRHDSAFGDGFKTKQARERELGPTPRTLTVRTPSDGEHEYFWTAHPLRSRVAPIGPGLDIRGLSGVAVAPGSSGYEVVIDAPVAQLPESWEIALHTAHRRKGRVPIDKRHKWLRGCAYAMACRGHNQENITRTLEFHRAFTCEQGGREIPDRELVDLASSAIQKAQPNARRGVA